MNIAYLAGVSQPTVSRALRGSPMVSEETRRRIESIAQQLMQDTRLAGEALVDSLLRSVHGEPAQNKVLPTRLVVRRSCGG